MKPCVSPASRARPTRAHRHARHQRRLAAGAHLVLAHADARQRRVGEQRVDGDAVADAARVVVEQVGGDDLVVVVRGVREGAAAIAVAERPDAGGAGAAQLVVDGDEAARVGGDAGRVEAEVGGVGLAADGEQQVRARHVGLAAVSHAVCTRTPFAPSRATDRHFALARIAMPSRSSTCCNGRRHLFVLARDDARAHLAHRDLRAEAAEDLRELEADVAAADHHQVLGQVVEFEDAAVVERVDLIEPRHRGPQWGAADVEEDARRGVGGIADLHRARPGEARLALHHREVRRAAEPTGQRLVRGGDDLVLPRPHRGHVHAHRRVEHDAPLGRAPRHLRCARAGDPGFRRHAAVVDAGAAERPTLDQHRLQALTGATRRERRPGLAGADHDGIELWMSFGHDGFSCAPAAADASLSRSQGRTYAKPAWRTSGARIEPLHIEGGTVMELKVPIAVTVEQSDEIIHGSGLLDLASGDILKVEYKDWDVAKRGLPWDSADYEFTSGTLTHSGKDVEFSVEVNKTTGQFSVNANELLEIKLKAAQLFAGMTGADVLANATGRKH